MEENEKILGEIFAEGLPEYEAAKKLEEFCNFVPNKEIAKNYLYSISEAHKSYLYMLHAIEEEDLETINYEAKAVMLTIEKFFIENVGEV